MATSKQHTLQDILDKGIVLTEENHSIQIGKIFIPRIQRSYAQGRNAEAEIRNTFLEDIFNCLCDKTENVMELSFLFGSRQPLASGGYGFELLDGQQRMTTLFLLHWYLWMKEKSNEDNDIPYYLKKFTYETRDTSNQFINKIVEIPISLTDIQPSKIIKTRKWFTEIFNCDATVCSMLIMLDAIDEAYKVRSCSGLSERLNRLRFYVLYLDEFELNDELYIKMNSRGLDLTPFENFKASLIRYMKKKGGDFVKEVKLKDTEMPYYLRFSTKMDTVWNDIFWKLPELSDGDVNSVIEIDNMTKDKKFFRFIIRYFFTKLVLNKSDADTNYKELEDFLYKNEVKEGEMIPAESEYALTTRLVGWKKFLTLIEMLGYEGLRKLEIVLDVFANSYKDIRDLMNSNPHAKWDWDVYNDGYTLPNRVAFATITEFIEAIPKDKTIYDPVVSKNFRQMLRVMWNIIANTKIEDVKPTISVIKAMSELIHLPGAVDDDFYSSIVNNSNSVSSRNTQLDEEISKARVIVSSYKNDTGWEDALKEAEEHGFFKGMIRFFFEETIPSSLDFKARYFIMQNLFDKTGIASTYRKEHWLMRALISKLNTWDADGLGGKYITENAEKEGYLKIILGTQGAKKLFCDYFNIEEGKGVNIEQYLKDTVNNAAWIDKNDVIYSRVFNRLVNDNITSILYDEMFDIEKRRKKCFRITNQYNAIMACIPYNERIVLDTERSSIITDLRQNNGLQFEDPNQANSMSKLGDVWGNDVCLYKTIKDSKGNDITLYVKFDVWKNIVFSIETTCSDISTIKQMLEQKEDRYYVKMEVPLSYDDSKSNLQTIKEQLNQNVTQIETILKGL